MSTDRREPPEMTAERCRLLAENAADVVFAAGADRRVTWVSPSVTAVLGWSPAELVGTAMADLVHPDDVAATDARWPGESRAGAVNPPGGALVRLRSRSGDYRWMTSRVAPVGAAGGEEVSLVGSLTLVDDLVRARSGAELERQRLHALLDGMLEPYVLLAAVRDAAGTVVDLTFADANPAALQTYQMSHDELVGRSLTELHPAAKKTDLFDRYVAVLDEGRPMILDDWSYPQDIFEGRVLRYDVRAFKVEDTIMQVWRDVTERSETARALAESEERLRATLDVMLEPNVVMRAVRDDGGAIVDFVFVDANRAAAAFNNLSREDLVGVRLLGQHPAAGTTTLFNDYVHVVETGEPLIRDDWAYPQDLLGGELRWYDLRAVKFGDGLSQTWRDVTDRYKGARRLAASEEQFRLLAENSSDVIVRVRAGQVVWASPSLETVLGWAPDEWIGEDLYGFVFGDDQDDLRADARRAMGGEVVRSRCRLRSKRGGYHWVDSTGGRFIGPDGVADGVVASFHISDEVVRAEKELQRRALYDDLTGALKRSAALDRLQEVGHRRRMPGDETAVLFFDIDEFKHVNDTWGHSAGDTMLEVIAERTRAAVRASDTVARIGGDEFLVLLEGVRDLDEALVVAEKIRKNCEEPVATRAGVVAGSVSIGVTLANPVESGDAIVARADEAMYEAKKAGRNQVITIPAG